MSAYLYSTLPAPYPGAAKVFCTSCTYKQGVMIGSDQCHCCEYFVSHNERRQSVKCIALTIKEELWGCKECEFYDEFAGDKDPATRIKTINGGRCRYNDRRMKCQTACPKNR